jgi:WD40 repeat protein
MIVLEGHDSPVTALAYAPGGGLLASGGSDGWVKLWDPLAGREVRTPVRLGPTTAITSLAFSPDGVFLAAGNLGGGVTVWSVARGLILRQHTLGVGETVIGRPALAVFSPDGERLAVGHGRFLSEYEPLSDKRLRTFRRSGQCYVEPHRICSLVYAPDGRLAVGEPHTVTLWGRQEKGNPPVLHWPSGDFTALSFSRDGRLLAAARERGVGLWDVTLQDGATLKRSRGFRHGDVVRAAALTPDGRTLLSGGDDWTVHVWDVATGQKRADFNWRIGGVLALAVAPDGMTVAVSGRKGPEILIWDLE